MEKTEVRPNLFVFRCPKASYTAEYISEVEKGSVVDGGQWRLRIAVWQTHNRGKPIQRTKRYPRYKRIGVFDSLEACETYVVELEGGAPRAARDA